MRIEILFPELCNLYGDSGNVKYLKASLKEAEFVYTHNLSEPFFVSEKVDMIYMGSMAEEDQILAVKRLSQYVDKIKQLIEEGVIFLITGNAMEIFGAQINDRKENGDLIEAIPMLGVFDYYSDRYIKEERHNSFFMGEFDGIKIVGTKSQFSFIRNVTKNQFAKVIGGCGNYMSDEYEGIRYKNFFATYLLGPLLVVNPLFTKYILKLLGADDTIAFEEASMMAYEKTKAFMEKKDMLFIFDEHF